MNASRWAICVAAVALLAMYGLPAAPENDWVIVPGKRVGPITAKTIHADLVRVFGAKNVVDEEVVAGDAGAEAGTHRVGRPSRNSVDDSVER